MSLREQFKSYRWAGITGAIFTLLTGIAFLHLDFRPREAFERASYDWSFDISTFHRPNIRTSEVVIVYLDNKSHRELDQPFIRIWDRSLHAELLNRLTAEKARAVIFDILFTDKGEDADADQRLQDALARNGRAVLGADYAQSSSSGNLDMDDLSVLLPSGSVHYPFTNFMQAAAAIGLVQIQPDRDFIVRQHFHGPGSDEPPSLSWAAAELLKLPAAHFPQERFRERWINYYGGPLSIPHVSYSQALLTNGVPPDFFRDKVVFVGSMPMVGIPIEKRDEFRTPYASWGDFRFLPAVEVHATMFLNLLRQDWLARLSPASELAIILAAALAFGFGLNLLRPFPAAGAAFAGMIAVTYASMFLFGAKRLWFPWMVVVFAQIPAALVWSVLFRSIEWYVVRLRLEQQRRSAEIQIKEQAELLDKARDAIIVQDLRGVVTYWNKSAERVYGWLASEIVGQNVTRGFFNLDSPQLGEARRLVLRDDAWSGELTQETKGLKEIIVESSWTLVRDAQHRPSSILFINTDVTEKKKLEAQFLRTQRMESIGTLAGGIAHDLNNVLAPITIAIELLRNRSRDESSLRILKTIETSSRRGADLVKQVLTFARGHEGEKTTLQLIHAIKEMEKIIRETFPKWIKISTSVAADLWPVMGDATQMHQILLNLCVNARDAIPIEGKIIIKAENLVLNEHHEITRVSGLKPGRHISFSVTDTGSGIPPEIIDRIFEPFFTTKEVGKGTGLGLSTVATIVKNHGGYIDVKSAVGKGTTFRIFLPAAESAQQVESSPLTREQLTGAGEVILVVDDEEAIRNLTRSILVSYGYRAIPAMHGAEAVTLCVQHKEDIAAVIVDMMMPVMDGLSTIRALSKLNPNLRFVGVSGMLQMDKSKDKIFESPNVAFLAKPFTAEKLLETLAALLRAPAASTPEEENEAASLERAGAEP